MIASGLLSALRPQLLAAAVSDNPPGSKPNHVPRAPTRKQRDRQRRVLLGCLLSLQYKRPPRASQHSTSIHNSKVARRAICKAMSLRYMSRVGARAAQAVRESTGRSVKDKAQSSASASMARSGGGSRPAPAAGSSVESGRASAAAVARRKAEEEKRRRAEQALRTVMFLSIWGPNT
ncbi:uncharacterized protein LOC8068439 [Sorghum bicolor]|nr:uncharacterized protein LOC8068439 [Sorghum bicolor]|eukprot:XP_002447176.2 uncharacterized protein LOC8068439 [Sorghum bicolor]